MSQVPRPGDWVVVVRADGHYPGVMPAGSMRQAARDRAQSGVWLRVLPCDQLSWDTWWVEEVRPATPAELASLVLDEESSL